jgi:CspA family cold shock protein
MRASVKFFNQDRGFGFAKPDDAQSDVFVHASQIRDGSELVQGDRIEFEMGTSPRDGRPCAVGVRLAEVD